MPVTVPAAEDVNRTPRLTCDVSESDSTAGVSELENRLTVCGVTVILKVSVAVRPPRSVTVTLTPTVPTAVDVPVNVRLAGANVSHAGSADPSAEVAE